MEKHNNHRKFSQRNCCKNCKHYERGEFSDKCKKISKTFGMTAIDDEYGICDYHDRDPDIIVIPERGDIKAA